MPNAGTSGDASRNLDAATVDGFGAEWSRFDQRALDREELQRHFEAYFRVFPWDVLPADAVGMDVGCGSGRWATLVAPKVGTLHCVDASSDALAVARRNLGELPQCRFHHASVDAIPLPDGSLDFGYSLGVLHHVPDTAAALRSCVRKLKRGAPFLVYLYYRFDNRPAWFHAVWRASDLGRKVISRLPSPVKHAVAEVIAGTVYWPLARAARAAEARGVDVSLFPLSHYRNMSFYSMRTDALDRFGTRLEQRFTRTEIEAMMRGAGLERIRVSDEAPYWCAVGFKA